MDTVKANTAAMRLLTAQHGVAPDLAQMIFCQMGWVVLYAIGADNRPTDRVAFITHDAALKWDMEA